MSCEKKQDKCALCAAKADAQGLFFGKTDKPKAKRTRCAGFEKSTSWTREKAPKLGVGGEGDAGEKKGK